MKFERCHIEGLILVKPTIFEDSRGHFFEAYNQAEFEEHGIMGNFVQDNQSFSTKGVIRGLHYQLNPHAQSKLVRVLRGTILDVAVDVRKGSSTYGQSYSVELSAENQLQLWLPAGFAHGFSVLSDEAVVLYKCDSYYHKAAEQGIRFDDPELNIDWRIDKAEAVVSEKDLALPLFRDSISNFA